MVCTNLFYRKSVRVFSRLMSTSEYLFVLLECISLQLHPDRDPDNPALHSQFVELNEAYRVLSKDPSRKEYDLRITQPYAQGQTFTSSSTHTSDNAR